MCSGRPESGNSHGRSEGIVRHVSGCRSAGRGLRRSDRNAPMRRPGAVPTTSAVKLCGFPVPVDPTPKALSGERRLRWHIRAGFPEDAFYRRLPALQPDGSPPHSTGIPVRRICRETEPSRADAGTRHRAELPLRCIVPAGAGSPGPPRPNLGPTRSGLAPAGAWYGVPAEPSNDGVRKRRCSANPMLARQRHERSPRRAPGWGRPFVRVPAPLVGDGRGRRSRDAGPPGFGSSGPATGAERFQRERGS